MGIFNRVNKFRLICLDKGFYDKQIKSKSPLGALFEQQVLDVKFLDIESFLKNKLLDGDWLEFRVWYLKNLRHLVFRVIRGYTLTTLRYILKTGNDKRERGADDPKIIKDNMDFKNTGLRPHEFIYAKQSLLTGWYASARTKSKNILILAYDRRLLKNNSLFSRDDVFVLEEGVNSFKQALSALILIDQKF